MLNHILNSKTKTVTSAAFLLAISSLISKILGLIRDRLLAGRFGAGEELDIYFAAFRIPDFVYGILIAGGITVAFLPIFSEYFQKRIKESSKEEWPVGATEFTNNLLNCFLFLLVLVCLILAIFTPFIINFIIPGFSPANKAITIQLTRIMFLSPILFGLSSIFSGILQYFDRFLIYSLAPILYNLGIIFGIVFLVPLFGISGLAYGVILGAGLHFFIQLPAAKTSGFKYKLVFNFKYPGIKKVLKLMIPRTIGAAADNLNLIVITAIASTLTAGSIAIFNFSNNLQNFPIGIIGISFAISSFPVLSRYLANGQKKEFLENFSSSFRQIIFLIIPLSFLLFLLRAQIVRLILGTGEFGWRETRLTAASLGFFCFGIIASSLIPLVARAFFSFQNTKTPVIIGITSVILNIFFCSLFVSLLNYQNIFRDFLASLLKLQDIKNIEVIGLPLGFSLSVGLQLLLLLIFLYKRIGDFRIKEILQSFKNILVASVLMAVCTYFLLKIFAGLVNMQTFFGVLLQTVLASFAGIFIYFLAVLFLRSPEIKIIKSSIFKRPTKTS